MRQLEIYSMDDRGNTCVNARHHFGVIPCVSGSNYARCIDHVISLVFAWNRTSAYASESARCDRHAHGRVAKAL
ncbi:hypothetical protein FKM82_017287 [Ascaphus truei]